jgi:hypothetical protein
MARTKLWQEVGAVLVRTTLAADVLCVTGYADDEPPGPDPAAWWDPNGEGLPVWAAYQPVGAASLSASYQDLSGHGRHLSAGVVPSWSAGSGWTFNGATQYLVTGFRPDQDQSQTVIIQFSGFATGGSTQQVAVGTSNGPSNENLSICLAWNSSTTYGYRNGHYKIVSTGQRSAGNLCIAGNRGYYDGSLEVSEIGPWGAAPAHNLYIGGRNSAGSLQYPAAFTLIAIAIYDGVLTSNQVAAVATAMAAIEADTPPEPPPPTGPAYYIAANGSDSNPGTLAQPWRTFAHAYTKVIAGDTVYVRGGTYNQRIAPSKSGTADARITFAAYPGETPIIVGTSNSTEKQLVYISGRNYQTLQGFTFQSATHWVDRYYLATIQNAVGTQILSCRFIREGDPVTFRQQGKRERGIQVSGTSCSGTSIEGCYVKGVEFGIHVHAGATNTVIYNNHITYTFQSCIDFGSHPDSLWQNNLVLGNILEGSIIEDGIQFEPNYDANQATSLDNKGTIIRGNVIRNNSENAIDLKGAQYIVIEENLIHGTIGSSDGEYACVVKPDGVCEWNRNGGRAINRGASSNAADVIIRRNVMYDNFGGCELYHGFHCFHNTFVANNRDYTGPDSRFESDRKPEFCGPYHMAGSVVIKNNIIVNHNTAEVQVRTNTGSVYINSNLYYNTRTLRFTDFRAIRDVSYFDGLPAWRTYLAGRSNITGKDASSFVGEPLFVNGGSGYRPVSGGTYDLRITENSPARNAAMPITYTRSAGSGTTVPVADALYFCHGMGQQPGDLIIIGTTEPVRITSINYSTNTLVIAASRTWANNAPIYIGAYQGSAPDIGAYEYGAA